MIILLLNNIIGLQTEMEADKEYTVMGRMTFVDLAGSERLKTTQSSGKVRERNNRYDEEVEEEGEDEYMLEIKEEQPVL